MSDHAVDIEKLLEQEQARRAGPKKLPPLGAVERKFESCGEDRYRLTISDLGVTIEVDRLRREHHELLGELSVLCSLPGASTIDGILSTADFNFSSARARTERAKLLDGKARTAGGLDWGVLLEEFCLRVIRAERAGQPAIDLRSLAKPSADDSLYMQGLNLPRRHPSILFGDGGAAKSYLALYLAGKLVEDGMRVALFDWELAGEDHRDRLERLFPDGMPRILYARCERPLVYEADRLRRIIRDNQIDYAVFDSVAFACDGPPEAAEIAGKYFRSLREIGGGSLHVAHMNKSESGDQKPFGSVFWNNGARSTWYAQRADELPDGSIIRLGLFNRKANLGPLRQPLGFTVSFTEERTVFRRSDIGENPELAEKLSIRQRMVSLLSKGAMFPSDLAEEMGKDPETVKRTIRRYKNQFTIIEGGRVGILDRRDS